MNQIKKILLGISFIVVGVVIGTNTLNLTNINIFFNGWWTLFIIIPSFIGLFDKSNQLTSNLIGLAIGIGLFLTTRGILNFEIVAALFVPTIFVIIGFSMIFNNILKDKITEKFKSSEEENFENIIATFSEEKLDFTKEKFTNSKVDAIFGSVVLDLIGSNLKKEVFIKSSAIFGGIKILLPNDVNVKVKSVSIFGGVTNKVVNKDNSTKTIYIESLCLFGGLEIK